MRKKLALALTVATFTLSNFVTALAAGCDITSYAFADIAGSISGNTITVTVPYKTAATYWDHRVEVSDGASFSTSNITRIDDQHYTGTITVKGDDGSIKEYTVNINKSNFMEPSWDLGKAKSIKKNGAKIPVEIHYNDANVSSARLCYYTKKNDSKSYASLTDGDNTVELTNLRSDTKYYYYVEIKTADKTYTSSAKSFTTKEEKDQGTSSSSSSSSSNKTQPSKGTNMQGPGTAAKEDTTKRDQWSLENGKWYYYGADGFTKVGWFQVGDKWYYVTKGTNDLAMSEWKKINDVWYYFDASGAMIANNWINSNGKWYWMSESGSMLISQEIDVGGRHYALAPDGTVLVNQFVMKDGRWQYYKSGAQGLAVNETFVYNGQTFRADAQGYLY